MTLPSSSLEAATNAESNADSNAAAEFPTGSSVPFPYETPYPQQTALMDTLLQCLKRHQKEIDKETAAEEKETSITSKKRPRKAAVMMLESPTGTGYVH